ncbi:MAG TPA: plasmid pRiA4b ORF-3 family protein [Candidatus Saccharimonadia bacterium]
MSQLSPADPIDPQPQDAQLSMVYQLKITLKDSRPPIWRRVLVSSNSTFWQLHCVIQDLFGWQHEHLHAFIRQGKPGDERVFIEMPRERDDDWFFGKDFTNETARELKRLYPTVPTTWYYHEQTALVGEWLTPSRPKIRYCYDFGDNWYHDIVLEKMLDPGEPDIRDLTLPWDLGGKRQAPAEDSRGQYIDDCTSLIRAGQDRSGELWRWLVDDVGVKRAERLVRRAEREAVTEYQPIRRFRDPAVMYLRSRDMGMFD